MGGDSVVDLIALGDEFRANATSALREMIRQHYNHPSVIMWGYMNEAVIQLQYRVKKQRLNGFYENTLALARHLEETLKREDPYRLSTMAYHGNQIYNKIGLSNITDISGWNLYQAGMRTTSSLSTALWTKSIVNTRTVR